jgi:hypothetical protein
MDYWCCGVWPSIGCGAVARGLVRPCRDFPRSANSIIVFLVKTRNLSRSRLERCLRVAAASSPIIGNERTACWQLRTRVATNLAAMMWLGSARQPPSKRRLANLVFIAHFARRTARPPWSSANTYVSANRDGWQQLYNPLTCLSLGCITQILDTSQVLSRYPTSAFRPP